MTTNSGFTAKKEGFHKTKSAIFPFSIEPTAHGIDKHVGSLEKGKIADLVLWKPSFFAVKPELVVKGGSIVWSQMGDANASIPTPGPVHGRPMFASFGQSLIKLSLIHI